MAYQGGGYTPPRSNDSPGSSHSPSSPGGRVHMLQEKSMSFASPHVASAIRTSVENGVQTKKGSSATFMDPKITSVNNTLLLSPFSAFSLKTQSYIYTKLLDIETTDALQKCGAINNHPRQQWAEIKSDGYNKFVHCLESPAGDGAYFAGLLAAHVMGDGNCCLHAASVALWGIQDRAKTLRNALEGMMKSKDQFFLKRWRHQEQVWDGEDAKKMGVDKPIERPDAEWEKEWADLRARSGRDGAFLTQIHLFVLAHVIRRPIIVYAHTEQDDSPCRFRGVYLPLEWPAEDCESAPILLGYHGSHFVPLIYHLSDWPPRTHTAWPIIPLEIGGQMLPVLFAQGRPTRVSHDPEGLFNCSDLELITARLPFERLEHPECASAAGVRIDMAHLVGMASKRLRQEVTEVISSNICKLIQGYLETGREEAIRGEGAYATGSADSQASSGSGSGRSPGVFKQSDSELARVLQSEEWESQIAISRGMNNMRVSPPGSGSPAQLPPKKMSPKAFLPSPFGRKKI